MTELENHLLNGLLNLERKFTNQQKVLSEAQNELQKMLAITEASKQLKQSTDGIEQALQNEQTLNSAIRHQQEQARAKKHAPYYGMSF